MKIIIIILINTLQRKRHEVTYGEYKLICTQPCRTLFGRSLLPTHNVPAHGTEHIQRSESEKEREREGETGRESEEATTTQVEDWP